MVMIFKPADTAHAAPSPSTAAVAPAEAGAAAH